MGRRAMTASIYQSLAEFVPDIEAELAAVGDTEPEALAFILAAIRDARADLAVVYGDVERRLLETMGSTKRFTVEGLGEVEQRRSNKRNEWANQDLTQVVVARALDERKIDLETGEVLESEAQAVARVMSDCARPSWRVTALKSRGIDPDEFCHVEWGATSITLPPRQQT
jgi:hypothetical protein